MAWYERYSSHAVLQVTDIKLLGCRVRCSATALLQLQLLTSFCQQEVLN